MQETAAVEKNLAQEAKAAAAKAGKELTTLQRQLDDKMAGLHQMHVSGFNCTESDACELHC